MPDLSITDLEVIADNDHWRFAVGKLGEDRWCGFALPSRSPVEKAFIGAGLPPIDPQMVMFLPEVCEGFNAGVKDKNRAILLTGAVAQDVESCYGGVDRWYVPEELRGDPEKYRCKTCEKIGCDGRECVDALNDYGEDGP
jgi:hypothetical protein